MNNIFVTGHILNNPVRFSSLKYYYTEIEIMFSNTKDKKNTAIVLADGEIGHKVFELYKKGDFVLVEGEFLVVENDNCNVSLVVYISNIQIINQAIKK